MAIIGHTAKTAKSAQLVIALLVLLKSLSAQSAESELEAIQDSVIKIYTTQAAPDYFTPWRLLTPRQSSGSGSVIAGNRILTNAHVVANASYVQAQKHNDPKRYLARVVFVSHDADLALITVDEEGFFNDLEPLALGELPEPQREVSVFGYPMGGKSLSITKGILSRVEQQIYAHAGAYLLAGQIDAAINPGNSGGPVIVDREIIGVVMQANSGGRSENLGYFVPPSIIAHVLADAEDGSNEGFPDLGFRTQTLDSPAAKSAYGLAKEQDGVLVIKVFEDSPAFGLVEENDVIVSIDDFPIAEDGSIRLSDEIQTDYKHAIDLHLVGDSVALSLIRNGHPLDVTLEAREALDSYSLVMGERFDSAPEYLIYGGVLFVPLNMNLIKRWGNDWSRSAPVNLLQARNEWSSPQRRQLVVALQVLAADVNLGYHDWRNWIVDQVNGVPIRDFNDFAERLASNKQANVVFENSNGYQMIINHAAAKASEQEILSRYQIPASSSAELRWSAHEE
jgi:S1-C subfamily serine protease